MPFPSPPPTALVVVGQLEASGNHVPVGFRLVDASSVPRYRAVPLVERRIAIDFRPARPGVSAVILGWTWEGIHVSTKAIREALSTPRAFELERRLPRGTESFWWTWEGPDGRIWPPAGRWTGSDPDIRMTIGG